MANLIGKLIIHHGMLIYLWVLKFWDQPLVWKGHGKPNRTSGGLGKPGGTHLCGIYLAMCCHLSIQWLKPPFGSPTISGHLGCKSILVGGAITILKNDGVRQWEGWHPIYEMENKIHVWNHQPENHQQKSGDWPNVQLHHITPFFC